MAKYKYVVSDYDHSMGKLGTFYRGERILFGWEEDYGVRDYKFVFEISLDIKEDNRISNWDRRPKYHEVIEFNHICNLKDYIRAYTLPAWMVDKEEGDDGVRYDLDETKLIMECVPDQFEYLKARLRRKFNAVIPEVVIYDPEDTWHKGDEFLQFTKDTAHNWAGPFEQDGKVGACMRIQANRQDYYGNPVDEGTIKIPIIDAASQWSWYCLPSELRDEADKFAKSMDVINGDHMLYKGDHEYKRQLFDTFTVQQKYNIFCSLLKRWSKESLMYLLPYSLRLSGNDDCSYTKGFATLKEAEDELTYLRMMQPLDMHRDIYERDYIFTN